MITVPAPLGEGITFRWFVEYIADNSPLFKTASAIAKASPLLAADLDTTGATIVAPTPTLKLFQEALSSDEKPLELPQLKATAKDADGNIVERQAPMRIYQSFIQAFLDDSITQTEKSE